MTKTTRVYLAAPVSPLTPEDIDAIIDGIEHFIIGDCGSDVDEIWRPYINKLAAYRATLEAEPGV